MLGSVRDELEKYLGKNKSRALEISQLVKEYKDQEKKIFKSVVITYLILLVKLRILFNNRH